MEAVFVYNILLCLLFTIQISSGMNSDPNRQIVYEKCRGPGDPGSCKGTYLYKWRFEITTQECTQFIWSGCHGNPQNRFDSEAECLAQCLGGNNTIPSLVTSTTPSSKDINVNLTSKEIPEVEQKVVPPKNVTLPPALTPPENQSEELIFLDSENKKPQKEFMFAQNNTFIQIDGDTIKTFQLRLCREISFQFRTRLPHGLLVYHNVKNPDLIELDPYALYVIVEKGQLKVVHVFGKHSTSVIVGEGLNRDEWHNVTVRIDVHGARLIARVDNQQEEVYLKGLNHDTNYGVSTNLPSVVLVGGLSSEEKLHGVKYIIESFVGCIRNIVLKSGKAASDLLPISPLIASKHENVVEGCHNKCESRENLCFVGSRCINHFSSISCDCFGTKYEGEQCDIYSATVLTLRGSSFVSYRIYDWKDRTHSSVTRISLMFRTWFDDSVLFYASGESIKPQYIAASLKKNKTYVEMEFGDGPFNCTLGEDLTSHYWHNLTILHDHKTVVVILDDQMKTFEGSKNLLFDPEIYFGGGPDLNKKKGLASNNNFAGSFKYVFYNDVSVLYELKKRNPKVHYIGVLKPEFVEKSVDVIPITYPFATSHIWWPIENDYQLNVKFDFKSNKPTGTLAFGEFKTLLDDKRGFWEINLSNNQIVFDLLNENNVPVLNSTMVEISDSISWHAVEFSYSNGTITLTVDYRIKQIKMYGMSFITQSKLIIGSSLKQSGNGLVGCMRDLSINGIDIEPRFVVKTERVVGEIALDNCQFVDPCARPNTCEHNGKCLVKNDRVTCDCTGTGYVGKNCHFTVYRKTCEELALLGHTKTDVYLIDIDGNGKLPPAHVKCEFQHTEDSTKTLTIVEHNLPSQVDVRSSSLEDFSFDIKYREFSAEMLQELISHSLYCTQNMRYDCNKAPLDLNSATWFKSSHKNSTTIIDFIGDSKRGSCPCKHNKTCVDVNESCNCDKITSDNKWSSDEGTFNEPHALGITSMYFIQQKNLGEEARGRITLGPLKCVETNTQKYVVTFTTSQSYIEVPGWRKGDIAFSFRTTGEKAILLFQPPIRPNFPSFLVALTGDYELTFAFTLNTGTLRERVINSTRKLNGGEWHKIWIDYNDYHVRFMINTNVDMVDLLPEEQFGPFEGSMYIGGATADLLKKAPVKQGLIGCFRGLVVNGEILDIYSYMSVHLSEIIKDCKPSCVPNPCKNGAQCKELWSNFQCVCKNPWAHVGDYCEINYNEKAITFTNRESYLKKIYVNNSEGEFLRSILKEDFRVNIRTYDDRALIMYAHDNSNNFVHLYISNDEVVYLFNYGNEIVNMTIKSVGLNNGKSIQIAVNKTETSTTLHVNDQNTTLDKGILLLTEYSNKPWVNPLVEVISPHRPPAPTVSYFQFNIGGYDPTNLLRVNNNTIEGLVGCVRGLRIGNETIDLAELVKTNEADHVDGVLNECQMICDTEPCKNGGICFENFAKSVGQPLCNCEGTSFTGEFCTEDRGGEFSGEAGLQRKFVFTGTIDYIKLQLAFSTGDLRRLPRMMLLLQTESTKHYLTIALNPDGEIVFTEERDSVTYTHTTKREPENFANSNRHSIYYKRNLDDAELFIDRSMVNLTRIQKISDTEQSKPVPGITNRVLIGISNSTLDPRFGVYKSYSGCISNLFLEINNQTMEPVDEYMLFKKDGSEHTETLNPSGLRSTQCNVHFDVIQKLIDEPLLNISLGTDKNWVEDSPIRKPYKLDHVDSDEKEEQTQFVFIILITLFIVIIICCIIEVYRTDRAHKRRIERETDESIIWAKEQATKMHESSSGRHSFKSLTTDLDNDPKIKVVNEPTAPLVGILKNGSAKANAESDKMKDHGGLRDSQLLDHEPGWDSLVLGSQNSLKTPNTDDDANETDMLRKSDEPYEKASKLTTFKPLRPRQLSFPPPTLNTQLPYKLEEEADEESDAETKSNVI